MSPLKDKRHDFANDTLRVTWSGPRCIHAAECVARLPRVFRPGEKPWVKLDQGEAERIAEVVTRCPTGALHYEWASGAAGEALPTANSVVVSKDGPLYLRGDLELCAEDGTVLLRDTRMALCRCGGSHNKPLCDNAHLRKGFREAGAIVDQDSVRDPGASGTTLRVIAHVNGPLELSGPFAIASADGATILAGTSAWLCRCGQSKEKPFCDASHERVGFQAE